MIDHYVFLSSFIEFKALLAFNVSEYVSVVRSRA
ncbi:hypothetical protein EPIR_1510 [Erwinia piriflorinigrans CFBP 5888]|uniref:Uncharacterized protein n=1 Tax=Erwinia piriflorinigrans CFBP 5888 TaxID=1161919 RepID=V5Z771_9GAMM|nr:hypothetical protein EPIR_1510 [Erwinia piriflorinigrans CFBP 5888]